MRQRVFLTLLGGTAVAWPLAGRARGTGRMRQLGVLQPWPRQSDPKRAQLCPRDLHRRLPAWGYIDGRNLQTEEAGVAA